MGQTQGLTHMSVDTSLSIEPAAAHAGAAPAFARGEGYALAVGALALGLGAGAALLFAFGRQPLWLVGAAGLAIYALALYLAALSLIEVARLRAPGALALYGAHVAGLALWPFTHTLWPDQVWAPLPGLPLAGLALAVFLGAERAPARAAYRTAAHLALIAVIAGYYYGFEALGG